MNKLFIVLGCFCFFGCQDQQKSQVLTSTTIESPRITKNEEVKPVIPEEKPAVIPEAQTLEDELAIVKSGFEDVELNKFIAVFVKWSSSHLRFSDIDKIETSFEKVMKDSDSERGKKICFAGRVIEIHTTKTPFGKVFNGNMFDQSHNVYHFVNVKSSGDIVEGSQASACGVVVGTYSYPNSVHGTTHTVNIVGMFDLPENNPKTKTQ
jgi:hypothetical protein